ncbi:MAG: ABC-2 family transporter protein [Ilumatobacteraceae bacterium]
MQAYVVLTSVGSAGVDTSSAHVLTALRGDRGRPGCSPRIWITGAASTFWTIDTMEITNSFTYGGRQLTSYPMTIYSSWLRRLVTYAVPLAVVGYYPVRGVLEREPAGTPVWVRSCGCARRRRRRCGRARGLELRRPELSGRGLVIELDEVSKVFVRRESTGRLRRKRPVEHRRRRCLARIEPGEFVGYLGPNGAGSRPR